MSQNIQVLEFEKPMVEIERKLAALREDGKSLKTVTGKKKIADLEKKHEVLYSGLTAWERVQMARHPNRPYMLDFIDLCFDGYVELHGDRHIGDDAAMPGGFAYLGDQRCVVIGHQKGRNTKENLLRNFGSANPEGYRKAYRLMKLAEKFHLPVVSIIDTPGAYPGIGAEERNIAEAIAFNLREMMVLRTPIVAVVIGEGGSGGALGIGVADEVMMMENAYYSVISPEGCAAILWKDRKEGPKAAEALKITAANLKRMGVVDQLVREPIGGAHRNHEAAGELFKGAVVKSIKRLQRLPERKMLDQRYDKFRKFGEFVEGDVRA
ncbi:MAG: acetyl-CoA carboxylase carboxyl transferase subunit alpha [Verrucomicrobiales bacterium]|jgi:acetyl-CoA carboxylase carboxyl transferase subunit alpha